MRGMLSTLVYIVFGILVMSTILYFVGTKIIPFLGRFGGLVYVIFEQTRYYLNYGLQMAKHTMTSIIDIYVTTMWSLFAGYVAFELKNTGGNPFKIVLTLLASSIAAGAMAHTTKQIYRAKEAIEAALGDVSEAISRMLDPYAYWTYSFRVVNSKSQLYEILKGIFYAYFYSKEELPSGKISEILYNGSISCGELLDIINRSFRDVVYSGYLLVSGCEEGENNRISVYSQGYVSTFEVDRDYLKNKEDCLSFSFAGTLLSRRENCGGIVDLFIKDRLGGMEFLDYSCFFDFGVERFISNSTVFAKVLNMYCNVSTGNKYFTFYFSNETLIKDYSTGRTCISHGYYTVASCPHISSPVFYPVEYSLFLPMSKENRLMNILYEEWIVGDSKYYLLSRVGNYTVIRPKVYDDIKSFPDNTKLVILEKLRNDEQRYLLIRIGG